MKIKLLYLLVVMLCFTLAVVGTLSYSGESSGPGTEGSPISSPSPTAGATPEEDILGDEPPETVFGVDIFSLVPDPQGCLTPQLPVARNEFEATIEPREALPDITASVEQLRGAPFKKEVPSEFLTQDEFVAQLERKLAKFGPRPRETRMTEEVLEMLRAIEPGTSLEQATEDLLTDVVGGLYSPQAKKLLVASPGSALGVKTESTLAHELGHALVDQDIGLPPLKKIERESADKAIATQALVEGDASVLGLQYTTNAMSIPRLQELQQVFSTLPGVPPSVPYVVEREAGFPYDEGMRFVCYLYSEGGWSAVDAAYRDPPTTTAEILFPYRYERGIKPENPKDPAPPPRGWKQEQVVDVGAAALLSLLQAPGGEPQYTYDKGLDSVLGWNGGEYHVYRNERTGEVALYMGLVNGGKKIAPGEMPPFPLSLVLFDWIDQTWPETTIQWAENSPAGFWRDRGSFYVHTIKGDQLGLAVAPSYEVARALASGAVKDLPRKFPTGPAPKVVPSPSASAGASP